MSAEKAISSVGTAISSTDSVNIRLRPSLSAKWPNTTPPSGRAR
jgi:hypothetical protein